MKSIDKRLKRFTKKLNRLMKRHNASISIVSNRATGPELYLYLKTEVGHFEITHIGSELPEGLENAH